MASSSRRRRRRRSPTQRHPEGEPAARRARPSHDRVADARGSSGSPNARRPSQTCGIDTSSARGSTRTAEHRSAVAGCPRLVEPPTRQRTTSDDQPTRPTASDRATAGGRRPRRGPRRPAAHASGRSAGDGRDDLLPVRRERRVLGVVLQVDRELVDAERRAARCSRSHVLARQVRGCRSGRRSRRARTSVWVLPAWPCSL